MQVPTTDIEKAKEVAKQLATRNRSTVLVYSIPNGRHEIIWHEIYLEGAPELRFFSREPDAKVKP